MEGFCLNRDYDFTCIPGERYIYPSSFPFPLRVQFFRKNSSPLLQFLTFFYSEPSISSSSTDICPMSNSTTRSIKFRIAITRTSEKLINETRRPSMLYVREISPSASNYRANYPGRKRNLLEPANLSPPTFSIHGRQRNHRHSIKTCSKNNQRKYNPSNRRTKDRDTEFLSDLSEGWQNPD